MSLMPRSHDLLQIEPYWVLARQGVLAVQTCEACQALYWPPRTWCAGCQCGALVPRRVSGRGRLWSFAVVHPPTLPALAEQTPFVAALIALDEGTDLRMGGNVVPARGTELKTMDPAALTIGMPLTVHFETLADGFALPRWSPA